MLLRLAHYTVITATPLAFGFTREMNSGLPGESPVCDGPTSPPTYVWTFLLFILQLPVVSEIAAT